MSTATRPSNAILDEQIRCAEALLEALAGENQALTAGNHDALARATGAKSDLVDALERLELERGQLTGQDGAPEPAQWNRLRELIARCKEQNHRNGTMLAARAENVRIALKALRGDEPELYGASGRTPARADARTLGTA